jgi:hypothetical protein
MPVQLRANKSFRTAEISQTGARPRTRPTSYVHSQQLVRRPSSQIRATRHNSWQTVFDVDPYIHNRARDAAARIANQFRLLNRQSYKLNCLLTVNLDDLADRLSTDVRTVLDRVAQLCRNLFRDRAHWFAGIWRREFGSRGVGGNHVHIVFHAPRGFVEKLASALSRMTRDPVAPPIAWRPQSGRRRIFQSKHGSWDLRRIYDLGGVLAYVSKVERMSSSKPGVISKRESRADGFKAFRTFGTKSDVQ